LSEEQNLPFVLSPFMLSYYNAHRPDGTHVQRFISDKTAKVLKVFGERGLKSAAWAVHSHGAWLPLEQDRERGERGERGELLWGGGEGGGERGEQARRERFERLMVILPRPEQHSPKLFTPWAERRLRHLNAYLERTNTGRFVRMTAQRQVVIGVLMRRRGHDLQDPKTPLPAPEQIPRLLQLFCHEVSLYISMMNDPELSFVQALKLCVIPKGLDPPEHKLMLDVLPTAVGLRGKSLPLSPVTLLRGVIGELAEQLDLRSEEEAAEGGGALARLRDRIAQARARRRALACVQELDALAARVDLVQPDFALLSSWVRALTPGRPAPLVPGRLIVAALCLLAALLLYVYG